MLLCCCFFFFFEFHLKIKIGKKEIIQKEKEEEVNSLCSNNSSSVSRVLAFTKDPCHAKI